MIALVGLALIAAAPARIPVPPAMLGTWGRHGRCDLLSERLSVTRQKVGWGKGPFRAVEYDTHSQAIAWREEGVVDDFVIGRSSNILVHETQGPSMPGEEGYARCAKGHKRVHWPPKW